MLKKIISILLIIACCVPFLVACGDDEINQETALEIYNSFEITEDNCSVCTYKVEQRIGTMLVNSEEIKISLLEKTRTQINKTLNPYLDGDDYLTTVTTISFAENEITKDGVPTTEYTKEDLTKVDIKDISLDKISDAKYENSTLTFTLTGEAISSFLDNASGIESVNFKISIDEENEALSSAVIEYNRGQTNVKINFSVIK